MLKKCKKQRRKKKNNRLQPFSDTFLGGVMVLVVVFLAVLASAGVFTITLNSPADDAYVGGSNIQFNCTGTSTSSLVNASFWTNMTGTWHRNETTTNIPSASAINESHQVAPNAPQVDETEKTGVIIAVKDREILLDRVYVHPSATATKIYLQDFAGTTTYATESLTGTKAVFSNISLSPNTQYRIVGDKEGASFSQGARYNTVDVLGTRINWSEGVSNNGHAQSDSLFMITEIFVNDVQPIFTKNLTQSGIWNCEVCDTDGVCDFAGSNYTLNVPFVENSQTYESSIIEGDKSEFIVNISNPSGYLTTGTLIYNNTEYSGTKEEDTDWIIFRRNVTAPGVETVTNKSFHWRIGLTDASGTTYINLTEYNQIVNIMNMSVFGSPYTTPFINFTLYDEETLQELNGTLDLTFTYVPEGGAVSNTFSYQDNGENNSEWSFAIDPADETYTIDAIIEIDATDYVHRFYNFQELEFTNDTSEISLYLLNESLSTSFIVSVRDNSYAPLTNVEVYIQRYYSSTNTWETVEITETNGDGRTLQHLYTEDTQYRFKIYDDGEHLFTSSGTIIYCEDTPCEVEVLVTEAFDFIITNFEDLDDLESSLEWEESSEKVVFEYSDTSGNFTEARLYVSELHSGKSLDTYVCNTTSSSSTAVLECSMTGETNGTYVASGYIKRDGDEVLVERISFNKIRDIVGIVGLDGVLWSMFLLIGIIMLGVYRPSLGIVFAVIGVIGLWALQLMEIPITALVSIVGIGVILLVEVKRQ